MLCNGIVLRTVDYGEADRILTLFTQQFGKMSVFVPGAHHSKKRFAQALDIFSTLEGELHHRRGSHLYLLSKFRFLNVGFDVRQSLAHIVAASMMVETVLKLTAEEDPHPRIFDILHNAHQQLIHNRMHEPHCLVALTLFRILEDLGFLPNLNGCQFCKTKINSLKPGTILLFSFYEGGLICPRCLSKAHPAERPSNLTFAAQTIVALDRQLHGEQTQPDNLLRFPEKTWRQVHMLSFHMVEHVCGSAMRSRTFINHLIRKPESDTLRTGQGEPRVQQTHA